MKQAAIVLGIVIIILLGVLAFVNPAHTPVVPAPGDTATTTVSSTHTTPPAIVPSPMPATSGVRGTVFLSPTCPVEHNPPDPACAPKGFSTSILVFKGSGISANPYKTVATDGSGSFTAALEPGVYTLQPKGGAPLPRCNSQMVTVSAGIFSMLSLQCDTGIR